MATPTTGSWGITIPGDRSMPIFVKLEARRKAEERTKRRAEEKSSECGSLSEEEEDEDPVTYSSNKEVQYEGTKTPFQSNPVDELESPPFKIHLPTTRSMPRRPIARPKQKATRKKQEGPSNSARKKCRG